MSDFFGNGNSSQAQRTQEINPFGISQTVNNTQKQDDFNPFF